MTYLRGFIPWIAYAVVSSIGADANWRWGALTALVLSVILILLDRRSGVKLDAQILEISAAVFFAALTIVAFTWTNGPVHEYDSSLSFGWLALTSWVSLAIGKPFTNGIARREVPEEYWETARFKRINVVITTAWAIAFTLTCIVVTLTYVLEWGDTVDIIAQVAGFVAPITFTNWYKGKAGNSDEAVQAA